MKIKINEYAEYNIKIKDSLDQQEFFQFLDTLNQIAKMIKKDFLVDSDNDMIQEEKKETPKVIKVKNNNNSKLKVLWDSKEKAIKLIKLHYWGTKEKREKAIEGFDITWTGMAQRIWNIRKKYNIQPKEVGLKRFPTIHDVSGDVRNYQKRLNALRI